MNLDRRIVIAQALAGAAVTFLALAAPPPARAQAATPAGYWEGTVTLPTGQLPVMIELHSADGAAWSGTMDIPIQGIRDLALSEITFDGKSVMIKLPGMPGNPVFNGALAEDGRTITGNYVQGQGVFPFSLERTAEPPERDDLTALYAPWQQPGIPGEGLAGTWRAMMTVGPSKLRLNLNVKRGDDGSLSATVDSVDQQSPAIPAASISLGGEGGRTVTISIPVVGASYEGTLSPDGSEISGTWKQGGVGMPLTWRRGQA